MKSFYVINFANFRHKPDLELEAFLKRNLSNVVYLQGSIMDLQALRDCKVRGIANFQIFGSFGYAKMSLYDRHLSLVLLLVLVLLLSALLASVSVDSLPVTFQYGCHIMMLLPPFGGY